jgi:hypothetical protein
MISLNVTIDAEDLVTELLMDGSLDPAEFILSLDKAVADEGFTLQVIFELTKTLIRDNEEYVEFLATKTLEQNFDPALSPAFGTKTLEQNFDPVAERNFSEEWEKEQTENDGLHQIKKLLSIMLKDRGIT